MSIGLDLIQEIDGSMKRSVMQRKKQIHFDGDANYQDLTSHCSILVIEEKITTIMNGIWIWELVDYH